MKFRFYITDLCDGSVVGTNSEELAVQYAGSEDNFVVDSSCGMWIQSDGSREEIRESKAELQEEQDEDEDSARSDDESDDDSGSVEEEY